MKDAQAHPLTGMSVVLLHKTPLPLPRSIRIQVKGKNRVCRRKCVASGHKILRLTTFASLTISRDAPTLSMEESATEGYTSAANHSAKCHTLWLSICVVHDLAHEFDLGNTAV